MTYPQTIDYLYQLLPVYHRIGAKAYIPHLENTLEICQHLGNPQHKLKYVHIAGTNGKGSSSHAIASVLQSAGYKVGLYTSPHLQDFTERIRVSGVPIPQQRVIDFTLENQDFIEKLRPSFFELTVGLAYLYLAEQAVDIAVIEVGLGGRLDSTNIITPEVSLITNISFDHADILGDTLQKIATEKAGIIKPRVPVVVSEYQPETAMVFQEMAKQNQSSITFASEEISLENPIISPDYQEFSIKGGGFNLPHLQIDLRGVYQQNNIKGVLATVHELRQQGFVITDQHIRAGLANITLQTGLRGRWQKLQEKPLIICDTGHNKAGILEVLKNIQTIDYQKLICVLGFVNDKEVEKILRFFPDNAYYIFCQANVPRAKQAENILEIATQLGKIGEVVKDVNQAIRTAQNRAGEEDFIFVGGSTFVVAEIENL